MRLSLDYGRRFFGLAGCYTAIERPIKRTQLRLKFYAFGRFSNPRPKLNHARNFKLSLASLPPASFNLLRF